MRDQPPLHRVALVPGDLAAHERQVTDPREWHDRPAGRRTTARRPYPQQPLHPPAR
ncbi:hypothetical protein ACFWOJ_24495 [Streptomyces sp. NPDC058439]|uniref:hypothetical protein n=1 Tax=Streptomyces sp. NPDC058439 TaxID=3346500 RepID=UPI003655451C